MYVPSGLDLGNGLSFFVTYNGVEGNAVRTANTGTSVTTQYVTSLLSMTSVKAAVTVTLKKTGTTPSTGTGPASDLPYVVSIGSNSPDQKSNGATFRVAGLSNIRFVGSTCTVSTPSVVNVDLGQVKINGTSGFGSAQGTTSVAKDFLIDMNCDTGAGGSYGVYMQLAATPAAGLGNSGVFALSAGSTATGLGIQLLRGSASAETPVQLGTPWQIGSFPMTSAKLSVPLSARYYQTGSKITPGTANGTATFTITYQ